MWLRPGDRTDTSLPPLHTGKPSATLCNCKDNTLFFASILLDCLLVAADEMELANEDDASSASALIVALTGSELHSLMSQVIHHIVLRQDLGIGDKVVVGSSSVISNGTASATKSDFSEGDRVEAKCRGWTRYYKGTVQRVRGDGALDIRFDDGERKRHVNPSQVRKLEKRKATDSRDLRVAALGDEVVVVIDKKSKRPYCIPRSSISSDGFGSSFLSGKHLMRFLQCFGRICALRGMPQTTKVSDASAATKASAMAIKQGSRSDYEALAGSLDILSSYKRRKWEGENLQKMTTSKSSVPSPTLDDLGTSDETQLTSICSAIDAVWHFSAMEQAQPSMYSEYVDTFDHATTFALEGKWSEKNERSLVKEVEALLSWKKDETAECWNEKANLYEKVTVLDFSHRLSYVKVQKDSSDIYVHVASLKHKQITIKGLSKTCKAVVESPNEGELKRRLELITFVNLALTGLATYEDVVIARKAMGLPVAPKEQVTSTEVTSRRGTSFLLPFASMIGLDFLQNGDTRRRWRLARGGKGNDEGIATATTRPGEKAIRSHYFPTLLFFSTKDALMYMGMEAQYKDPSKSSSRRRKRSSSIKLKLNQIKATS